MATVCQLTSQFQESPACLYQMFTENIQQAQRLGTRWDVIQEENFQLANGGIVKQVIGYSSAFARVDGMGGFVNFVVRFTTDGVTTEVDVTVSSPYQSRKKHSSYDRRNHHVALRLLEFCVAPYSEIHTHLNFVKRVLSGILPHPTSSSATLQEP